MNTLLEYSETTIKTPIGNYQWVPDVN